MIVSRRGLLRGLVAAPAVVAATNLMPVRAYDWLTVHKLWADGVHDDTAALQALMSGGRVSAPDYVVAAVRNGLLTMRGGVYRTTATLVSNMPTVVEAVRFRADHGGGTLHLIIQHDGDRLNVMSRCTFERTPKYGDTGYALSFSDRTTQMSRVLTSDSV